MRLIETWVCIANFLSCTVVALRLPRARRWMWYVVPSALLIAVAQILVEGPRWQMIPAYTLTGLLVLVWLVRYRALAPRPTHRISRRAIGLAVGLGALGLAVSMLLPLLIPVFRFPQPGGPYAIGTLTYHWADADRRELFSADPDAQRELMVQIWYPATQDRAAPRAPYVQDADALALALARLGHVPTFTFGHFAYVTTNAVPGAPVAAAVPSYPVLLFLEGAIGFRQMNTFQVEELVSHGYIVVAIDQPYTAATVVFPDGREAAGLSAEQIRTLVRPSYIATDPVPIVNGVTLTDGSIIPYLARDVSFTLDQLAALNQADPNGLLTGRLDMTRVGTFGVSLGGIFGAEACRREPRLRACLVMDAPMPRAVMQAGLRQPSMWITRDAATMRLERARAGGWPEDEILAHQTTMRATFENLQDAGYFVQIPGMFHVNLTDVPHWSPLLSRLGVTGPIDGQRAHGIINAYSLAFFDRHLRGRPAALLDNSADQYPEVRLETR